MGCIFAAEQGLTFYGEHGTLNKSVCDKSNFKRHKKLCLDKRLWNIMSSFGASRAWLKWAAMFVVTVLGVLIPIGLWVLDLNSKSLLVRIVSEAPVAAPIATNTLSDLAVSYEGRVLKAPYLVVVEVSNDGYRSILSNEYEEPIRIEVKNRANLVSAQLIDASPAGFEPAYIINKNSLEVSPTLLNPGDSMRFMLITDEEKPNLIARARIAGIRAVSLSEFTPTGLGVGQLVRLAINGFGLVFVYVACFIALVNKEFALKKPTLLVAVIASGLGASKLFAMVGVTIELSKYGYIGLLMLIVLVSMALVIYLNKRQGNTNTEHGV